MKKIIQIVLGVTIVVLAYLLFESISKPIRFEAEKKKISEATIERLKTIRTAQNAYKEKHGEYAKNFDKLISFIKTDSFDIKKPINLGWDQDEMTQKEAIRAGKLKFEITKVSVIDSLFKNAAIVDSMRYVPFSGGYEFELGADEVLTGSKVRVKVFEAKVHNNILYKDLDRQLVINLNDEKRKIEKYPGLKVGSLIEANNNAGNWE
ncbi:hypothetical protein ACFLTE_07895 [Bacteroidota bacterium]